MTVYVEKPAVNLREELTSLRNPARYAQQTFWFAGNSSQTVFPVPQGWKPVNVFVDGAIYRPGSGEDYTISFDGFTYSITFAVAPTAVDVAIIAEGTF